MVCAKRSASYSIALLRAAHFGEEVDAYCRLVHIIERVVHEARDERRLANCTP